MTYDLNLFSATAEMVAGLDSLYKGNRSGRMDLLEFMDANEWFGISYRMIDKAAVIQSCDFERLRNPLTLWLSAYKKPGREKINLMLQYFNGVYPQTCTLFRKFVADRQIEDEPAVWKLLDFLFSEIDREITEYGESGLEMLMKNADTNVTLLSARLLADFLRTAVHNGKPLTQWVYGFDSRDSPELIKGAYSLDSFSVMAYCIFNEEMWVRQTMIEKAVQNKAYADLWLFAALHFICALRSGDMKRLPAPALPYEGATVLRKIAEGSFAKQEASALTEELSIRLKLKPMKPAKTASHGNVPNLKLFVPESLKAPLGTIMAIALAHHPEITPGSGFVAPCDNLCNIRDFFGEPFAAALGNRRFSSRRCNKSYLQGIEAVCADDSPGKPKGYMLAALARSHKSGIGTLAKTTEIYLKDARFSGYSPEFIIREMFERGVFSFIPVILLEMYAGVEYKLLPVRAQTMLINEIGLAAHLIEWTASAAERALAKSRNAVNSAMRNPATIKESVAVMLQNIASGNAPGRQEETLCLMTAAGLSCRSADRDSCIGCGYEIYTKSAMHTLMREYARLTGLKQSSGEGSWRYGKILEQAILPAVAEMLSSMKLLYSADTADLLDIVERGLELADHGV
jgi:hypothetical protein